MDPIFLYWWLEEEEEEEEEERKREEQRRREEEKRREKQRMINHRKESPVVCNDEEWQQDRCVKAISMQPCVQEFVTIIDKVKLEIIEAEEKKYDARLIDAGYEYERVRNELNSDIESLQELGISIKGSQYELLILTPINTNVAKPTKDTESFGSTFSTKDKQPIELNSNILSTERYFEIRYREMNPEGLDRDIVDINLKKQKYQKIGKYLKFLLRTHKYISLEEESEHLLSKQEECELRKKEMQSFQSLTKEQLLAIKSYFIHLDQLRIISSKIEKLFNEKSSLRNEYKPHYGIYDLTVKDIILKGNNNELVNQVHDYISRIYDNDEETMKQAYELVKGEYPIEITNRFIYDLIIKNMRNYTKAEMKELILK